MRYLFLRLYLRPRYLYVFLSLPRFLSSVISLTLSLLLLSISCPLLLSPPNLPLLKMTWGWSDTIPERLTHAIFSLSPPLVLSVSFSRSLSLFSPYLSLSLYLSPSLSISSLYLRLSFLLLSLYFSFISLTLSRLLLSLSCTSPLLQTLVSKMEFYTFKFTFLYNHLTNSLISPLYEYSYL